MDENDQDKGESKLIATEDKLHPLSSRDQRGPDSPQNNRMRVIIKRLGFFGYDKETKEYTPDEQLTKITKEYQPGKTFWDWLQLLIIPLLLVGATIGFGWWQAHLADLQHQTDLKIAQDNRQTDLKIAYDQQQEATLKAYLDDMTTLLLDKKLGSQAVTDQAARAEAAVIARAKTLTALRRLTDPQRKAAVVQFLYEAKLINKNNVIVELRGADLSDASLGFVTLSNASLSGANLSRANLSGAILSGANLSGAILSGANLSGAILSGANLIGANLIGANLTYAHLSGANFFGANLREANLCKAKEVTQEQLQRSALSLEGATMLDCTKHP